MFVTFEDELDPYSWLSGSWERLRVFTYEYITEEGVYTPGYYLHGPGWKTAFQSETVMFFSGQAAIDSTAPWDYFYYYAGQDPSAQLGDVSLRSAWFTSAQIDNLTVTAIPYRNDVAGKPQIFTANTTSQTFVEFDQKDFGQIDRVNFYVNGDYHLIMDNMTISFEILRPGDGHCQVNHRLYSVL